MKRQDCGFLALVSLVAALTAANIGCAYFVSVDRPDHVYMDNSPPAIVALRPAMCDWHVYTSTGDVYMGKLSVAQAAQLKTNAAAFLAARGMGRSAE